MVKLKQIGAALYARFFNLYTLRAIVVVALSAIAPHVDPTLAGRLTSIADHLGAGGAFETMLAVFGGGYVLKDIMKARRKAMPEAGPDYSWISGK